MSMSINTKKLLGFILNRFYQFDNNICLFVRRGNQSMDLVTDFKNNLSFSYIRLYFVIIKISRVYSRGQKLVLK